MQETRPQNTETTQVPPRLSFVLPAYNEGVNLRRMAKRLLAAGRKTGEPFEIVWVNDGSSDNTEDVLEAMADKNHRIRPVHLSRNFGHMAALTAGLDAARATGAVITLDSDGQHPPELIPDMVALWKQGADIVQGVRRRTDDASGFKRLTSWGFYHLLKALSNLDLPEGAADFRLLDREVVDVLNELPERTRFLRGLVYWIGFDVELLPFHAPHRQAGRTKYDFTRMLSFALNGITAFSMRPLRLTFFLGFVVLLFTGTYALWVLWCYITGIPLVAGWTSLLLVTLFLSGIQLLMLGVASEYLGRLFSETKNRPIYITRKPRRAKKR